MTGVSWAEYTIIEKYKAEGYDIIHNGKPDLILLKDGRIEFVEVKLNHDQVRPDQERAFKLLWKHGFEARVEHVRRSKPSKKWFPLEERLEIIRRHRAGELSPGELWDLIVRSYAHPGQEDLTGLLIGFFNESNTEVEGCEG